MKWETEPGNQIRRKGKTRTEKLVSGSSNYGSHYIIYIKCSGYGSYYHLYRRVVATVSTTTGLNGSCYRSDYHLRTVNYSIVDFE